MQRKRPVTAIRTAGFAGLLLLLALFDSMGGGVGLLDEVWFLQVATRVADGDVLYRDVYFNTTPLSVELAAAGVALFGSGILVVKLLAAAGLAAAGVGCACAARELGASPATAMLVGAAGVVIPGLSATAPYTYLAVGALSLCLAATLRWQRRGAASMLALAAAAAGVSFSFKHSTGLLALAALAVGVLLARERLSARALGGAVAALVICIALPLLPVLVQGGGPKLFEYGVTAKTSYADAGAISYLDGLERGVRGPDARHLFFALPLIVVPLLGFVVARPGPLTRTAAATTAAFVVAALANAWPRVDLYHLLTAAPLLLLALWLEGHVLLRDRARRVAGSVATAALAAALVVVLAAPVLHWARDDWEPSDVPHLRGALMPASTEAEVRRRAASLGAAERAGGPVLVLAPDAALRHLVSGVPNSTPWDYPLVTTFGPDGEEELRQAIEGRRFDAVCIVTSQDDDPLRPRALESAVRRTLRPAGDGVGCTFYR